jgi:tetratricopeptide (TPR) repeat protein
MPTSFTQLPDHQSRGPAPGPPWRALWQIPAFTLGVAVTALTLWLHPAGLRPTLPTAHETIRRALEALDRDDCETAARLAQSVLETQPPEPRAAADARFILGGVLLKQAQASPPDGGELLQRARLYLEEADRQGVSDELRFRLAYRLAVIGLAAAGEPARCLRNLEEALDNDPADRLEGYRYLTTYHLSRPTPNLEAALRANERLLMQPNLVDPNPVRLQRGEILLRLKRTEEARSVLARIPTAAAEAERARHLRALSHYQDEDYRSALALWNDQGVPRSPAPEDDRAARYYVGMCHARLDRLAEASAAWESLAAESPESPEGRCAAFRLAEVSAATGQRDRAFEWLRKFFAAGPTDDLAPYLTPEEARQSLMALHDRWAEEKSHRQAADLARLATPMLPPGEGPLREARSWQAEGFAQLRRAAEATGSAAEAARREALLAFGRAAEAFEGVARVKQGTPGHADALRATADNLLRARQYSRAAAVLERYLALDLTEKQRGEALVGLGEAYHELKEPDKAVQLLKEALRRPGPLNCRARYLLALAQLDQGKLVEAEATLRELATTPPLDPEPPEFRQSLFALGYLLYKREQYAQAADYLKKAIDEYPKDPHTLQARYWLGEAYRQCAYRETASVSAWELTAAKEFYHRQRRNRVEQALPYFEQLVFELTDTAAQRPLSAEEQFILVESRLSMADCYSLLGRNDQAVSAYQALVASHPNQLPALRALRQLAGIYLYLKMEAEAAGAVKQAKAVLDGLTDKDLEPSRLTRAQWQESLDAVLTTLRGPG